MFPWLLENTVVAGGVALLVAVVVRLTSPRPAVAHCLWLATLGVLLMPGLPWFETPGSVLRRALRASFGVRATLLEVELPEPVQEVVDPLQFETETGVGAAAVSTEASVESLPALFSGRAVSEWGPDAIGLAWLAGAAFVLARSARRILPFQRLVQRSPLAPRGLRAEVRMVARELGVRAPEVRVVEGVASPSIWCLGRPRLLWPAHTEAADSRRALIAHELAHLARRDHWVSWLEIPAAALAWWNPLFWWIRGRIRHFAELSCDAWAVWTYPADRRLFAEALIDLQARTRTAPVALQGLGATDSECKDFERRLDMIMKKRMFPGVSRNAAALAAVLAVLTSPGFSGGEDCAKAAKECTASAVVEARAKSMLLSRKAVELLGGKQDADALALLQEIVTLEPENAWAHNRLGFLQLGAGQFDAAKQSFMRQYELGYERPNALYNAGCASARGGDSAAALEHVVAAVNLGFADAALMAKDKDLAAIQADERFQAAIQKARTATELRNELARLERDGDDTLFLATHAELAAIVVGDGKLQSEQGHLALMAGDAQGAVIAFGRQVEAGFDVHSGLYNRACARARAGDVSGAMGDLRIAAEKGFGYDGMAKDTDLERLRKLPGFADLQQKILATAETNRSFKALLTSENQADAPALAALVDDETRPAKVRTLAAQSLGRIQLGQGHFADAFASFERASAMGMDVRQSAFDMARALAGAGKKAEARRHVELAVDLGYADPDALRKLLESSVIATPAEAEALIGRAAEAMAKGKAKTQYGEKGKAWAAGLKTPPKVEDPRVASDNRE